VAIFAHLGNRFIVHAPKRYTRTKRKYQVSEWPFFAHLAPWQQIPLGYNIGEIILVFTHHFLARHRQQYFNVFIFIFFYSNPLSLVLQLNFFHTSIFYEFLIFSNIAQRFNGTNGSIT
jgi:hypothetical protein